jgi:hypothetical protein
LENPLVMRRRELNVNIEPCQLLQFSIWSITAICYSCAPCTTSAFSFPSCPFLVTKESFEQCVRNDFKKILDEALMWKPGIEPRQLLQSSPQLYGLQLCTMHHIRFPISCFLLILCEMPEVVKSQLEAPVRVL